jgi:hypothetical protein
MSQLEDEGQGNGQEHFEWRAESAGRQRGGRWQRVAVRPAVQALQNGHTTTEACCVTSERRGPEVTQRS